MKPSRIILIVSLALSLGVLGLGYYLYASIKAPIEQQRKIKAVESKVIEKLKLIRDLQLCYFSVNNVYANNFNDLKSFVNKGNFYLLEISEETVGAFDSVEITIDTLATIPVKDSLSTKYPELSQKISTIEQIPGSDSTFSIFAGKLYKMNDIEIDVFEVTDTDPIDPDRQQGRKGKSPLKIGSRSESTARGNWE